MVNTNSVIEGDRAVPWVYHCDSCKVHSEEYDSEREAKDHRARHRARQHAVGDIPDDRIEGDGPAATDTPIWAYVLGLVIALILLRILT
ncbi:hypothetical protein AB0D98_18865 [Streptomyces sp. NPDC047987]|uniref:hypothetical protein n=1 Tax=unclassified Streptomyces TaxID=2593676 RepID=UPI003442B208